MAGDDQPDAADAAMVYAMSAAGKWMTTRFPDIPEYVGRFIAAELTQIIYPYLKVAVYASMADRLREEADLDHLVVRDVAQVLDDSARDYLDQLINPKENS